MIAVDLIWANL